MEYINPYDHLKPSFLIGTIEGRLAAAELKAVEQAKAAFTEGVKAGELKAQIAYDQKLAQVEVAKTNEINAFAAKVDQDKQNAIQVLQANLDRTTQAYQSTYSIAQTAVQAGLQMEQQLSMVRAETVSRTQGFNGWLANVADAIGALGQLTGDRELSRLNGDQIRDQMTSQITRGGMQNAGAVAAKIMSQFPNPAQFRIEQEQVLRAAFQPAK